MNHIGSNLYSAFVANLSNKSDTVMAFGIFHKPSASSLGFVSGILPCLGESSSRPLFPVPSAGTETSTITPTRTSQRCQPLLLSLFSQRQAKPDCLGSAHIIFFAALGKMCGCPGSLHEAAPQFMSGGGTLRPPMLAHRRPGYSRGSRPTADIVRG